MKHILGYRCTICGKEFPYTELMTCPDCGEKGILDILLDYDYIKKCFTKKSLADNHDNSMFRYAPLMYALFSAGLMFPMTVGITPLYLLIRNLGLANSLWGLILPQIAFGLPQTIIILVPFLQSIPNELEEACLLDGCSRLGFFWRMVIPLSMPGVATTGILTFVGSWNAYMLPLFVLSDANKYTLPLGVQMFSSEHSVDTAQVLAFTSLAMIPALICFTIFQKKIVGGLTGAVKG